MEFTLDGNLQQLGRLAEEVAWFCEENALDSEIEFDLNLAMEELFTNSLRHGGCEGLKDAVRVRLQRAGDRVEAEFSDRGRAFDPASAPAVDLEAKLEDRSIGGLGLHLVRRTMGDLAYSRSEGWNHIGMRRAL